MKEQVGEDDEVDVLRDSVNASHPMIQETPLFLEARPESLDRGSLPVQIA